MSDTSQGPDWWIASDDKGYPPHLDPNRGPGVAVEQESWERSDHELTQWTPPSLEASPSAPQRIPPLVLVLGTILGWGPWSVAIAAWQIYGHSGYTLRGQSASTSEVHSYCSAGGAALQPGICGSVDAHWAFGVALLVTGVIAFFAGMVGLFVVQQRNPSAWRQSGKPILAGLVFGLLAVTVAVIMAIARAVREGRDSVPYSSVERPTRVQLVQQPLPPPAPQPNWYPDPYVPGALRWWDGKQWGPSAAPVSPKHQG